ncbi:hypothetical protein A2U01_0087548, partial [Trifolium medium]|nr:hypothetical protein [Trifolium medium]
DEATVLDRLENRWIGRTRESAEEEREIVKSAFFHAF